MKTVFKCVIGLLILTQACVSVAPQEAIAPLDAGALDTAIAETMAAAQTQTAQAWVTDTPTFTAAPTNTLTASPFPTFTLVVAAPLVWVTKSTHCRAGPGEAYKSLGALKAGEAAQAVGRSKDAKYWIIRNPARPSQLCWLSGKYASVSGIAGILPIFTAPPKPTATRKPKPTRTPTRRPAPTAVMATFTATYNATVNCLGTEWYVQFNLTNTGKETFQSVYLIGEDTATLDPYFTLESNDFINSNGCSSDTADTLPPGASHLVSLPPFTYDPTGHVLNVGIWLCTEPDLVGTCPGQILTIKP